MKNLLFLFFALPFMVLAEQKVLENNPDKPGTYLVVSPLKEWIIKKFDTASKTNYLVHEYQPREIYAYINSADSRVPEYLWLDIVEKSKNEVAQEIGRNNYLEKSWWLNYEYLITHKIGFYQNEEIKYEEKPEIQKGNAWWMYIIWTYYLGFLSFYLWFRYNKMKELSFGTNTFLTAFLFLLLLVTLLSCFELQKGTIPASLVLSGCFTAIWSLGIYTQDKVKSHHFFGLFIAISCISFGSIAGSWKAFHILFIPAVLVIGTLETFLELNRPGKLQQIQVFIDRKLQGINWRKWK